MKDQNIEDELTSIRSMMERSSKFISLSGLSGILAGIYAVIGAVLAYKILYSTNAITLFPYQGPTYTRASIFYAESTLAELTFIAVFVLLASLVTGVVLSFRKAKRKGQQFWGNTSRALLFNMALPLLTGGIFMLIMINRGYYGIVAPASLIFYGMALICGSHYTFTDVKYLGTCEILLGLAAAALPGYGLIFWTVGFGVLHIIYGSLMYFKYDR
jgi:hypothetical protein